MLLTLFYFLFALLLLVTIHEYGHFAVARLCGVKVLRFSFGFGRVLFRWRDKRDTEYVISALPLGGYVKMLDENEGPVMPHEKHLAFNNQSVFARMAIVLAGPFFNFVFAWFAFWLVLMIGGAALAPIIDRVIPGSIAERAGFRADQEIVRLDDQPIRSWRDVQYQLMPNIGSDHIVAIHVESVSDHQQSLIHLPLAHWLPEPTTDPLTSLGIVPFIPKIPPTVGEVIKRSVAEQAGFLEGDHILRVNQKPIDDWLVLVKWVQTHPKTAMTIDISRQKKLKTIKLITASQIVNGKNEGMIGLRSQKVNWPEKWVRFERQPPIPAANAALKQTIHISSATIMMIGRLISGHLGIKNISGPIGIAQGAGNSGRIGIAAYLSFMALISISLGVLNLLPIPLLDGGHFLYCLIELICRRPLSEKNKARGLYFGVTAIGLLMCIAVYNDMSRLLSP